MSIKIRFICNTLAVLVISLIMTGCPSPTSSKDDIVKHTITFDKNNDQATGTMGPQSGAEGDTIQLPSNNFSLNGYRFTGWSTTPSGSVQYENGDAYTLGNSDITLYAQWERLTFRTKWEVSGTTLRFPLYDGGNYDFTIWWGDGSSETVTNDDVSGYYIEHTYSTAGTYEVKIQGTCDGFGFQDDFEGHTVNGSLIDVMEWGEVSLHDLGSQFIHCTNLVAFSAEDELDTSNITNMSKMFRLAYKFNGDISAWDVGNVTNMERMFESAQLFNQNISGWDVSKIENMGTMFGSARNFNMDISPWDVSNVTNMERMFEITETFNQNISRWDVSSVTTMEEMFFMAESFSQNISAWGSKVAEDIEHEGFSTESGLITEYLPHRSWEN